MLLRRLVLPCAAVAALVVPGHAAAAPKIKRCPTAGTTLAREKVGDITGRVYRLGGVLYGCSTVYPAYGRVVRWGRVAPRLVDVDGDFVVWTERRGGADRVVRARFDTRAVNRSGALPGGSGRVDAARADSSGGAAWITRAGALVVAAPSLEHGVVTAGAGDVHPLPATGEVGVADDLPGLSASARRKIVSGMRIIAGSGETDDCGGTFPVTWRWSAPLGTMRAIADVAYVAYRC